MGFLDTDNGVESPNAKDPMTPKQVPVQFVLPVESIPNKQSQSHSSICICAT